MHYLISRQAKANALYVAGGARGGFRLPDVGAAVLASNPDGAIAGDAVSRNGAEMRTG